MPDIVFISAAIASIKNATDTVKLLRDSVGTLQEAENKLRLAELIDALAETKIQVTEIKSLIIEKDEEISSLKTSASIKEEMVFKSPVYVRIHDGIESGPYCQKCYDDNEKLIHLQTSESEKYECAVCQNIFLSKAYHDAVIDACQPDYDTLG